MNKKNLMQNKISQSQYSMQQSKTFKNSRSRLNNLSQQSQKAIICLSCNNQLLTLQQFLTSVHRTHSVQSIQKHFPIVQQHLTKTFQQLISLNQSLFITQSSLIQLKKQFNQSYQSNINKIKQIFILLKSVLQEKQKQIIKQFQNKMITEFQQIQNKLSIIQKNKINNNKYSQQIQQSLEIQHVIQDKKQIVRTINFYINNQHIMKKFIQQTNNNIKNINKSVQSKKSHYQVIIKDSKVQYVKDTIAKINLFGKEMENNIEKEINKQKNQYDDYYQEEQNYQQQINQLKIQRFNGDNNRNIRKKQKINDNEYFMNKKKEILQQNNKNNLNTNQQQLTINKKLSNNLSIFNQQTSLDTKQLLIKSKVDKILSSKLQKFNLTQPQNNKFYEKQKQRSPKNLNYTQPSRNNQNNLIMIKQTEEKPILKKLQQLRSNLNKNKSEQILTTSIQKTWNYN